MSDALTFDFNWAAMVVAAFASLVFGWIWYGPLFGKKWSAEMGIPMDDQEMGKMIRPMFIHLAGAFIIAYILTWLIHDWGVGRWHESSDIVQVLMVTLFAWGLHVPVWLNGMGWENRSVSLTLINAVHGFLNLFLVGVIVGLWT